jgi:excisionase family DNA binding protein
MKFFTVAEVAQQLGCGVDLVRSHIATGRLKAIDVGSKSTKEYRIGAEWLQSFIESSRVSKSPKQSVTRKQPELKRSKWLRDLKKETVRHV